MIKFFAIWHNPERAIKPDKVKQICDNAIKGDTQGFPPHKAINALAGENSILKHKFNIKLHTDNFCFMESIFGGSVHELLNYSLKNDLLLYNYTGDSVLCCAGRYGLGNYALYLENGTLFDDPDYFTLHDCIYSLNIKTSFAILESHMGYMQTAKERGDKYIVEWNKGNGGEHYILDELTDTDTVLNIFSAYTRNDIELINCYKWKSLTWSSNKTTG